MIVVFPLNFQTLKYHGFFFSVKNSFNFNKFYKTELQKSGFEHFLLHSTTNVAKAGIDIVCQTRLLRFQIMCYCGFALWMSL